MSGRLDATVQLRFVVGEAVVDGDGQIDPVVVGDPDGVDHDSNVVIETKSREFGFEIGVGELVVLPVESLANLSRWSGLPA